jgi:hypothetical protein
MLVNRVIKDLKMNDGNGPDMEQADAQIPQSESRDEEPPSDKPKKKKKTDIEKLKNELWTRVIELSEFKEDQVESYDLKEELITFKDSDLPTRKNPKKNWKYLYDPEEAVKSIKFDELEDHELKTDALKALGVKISIQRRYIRDKALAADLTFQNENLIDPEVSTKLARKIQKGFHTTKKQNEERRVREDKEETPHDLRQKRKNMGKLALDQRLEIVFKSLMNLDSQTGLAKEYGVSPSTISLIITKAKRKPEVLREALGKQHEEESETLKITQEINKLDQENSNLNNAR